MLNLVGGVNSHRMFSTKPPKDKSDPVEKVTGKKEGELSQAQTKGIKLDADA